MPDEFQRFYWDELDGRDLSIVISSEEPYIPWELVKPRRASDGQTSPMLGVAFSVARWRQDRAVPTPLTASGFAVVAPDYKLANPSLQLEVLPIAQQEATDLISMFAGRLVPGNYGEVTGLLRSPDVQAIHFSGHGKFDPVSAGNSKIDLIDNPLLPSDIQGAISRLPGRPLIFLNACEVGDQGWSYRASFIRGSEALSILSTTTARIAMAPGGMVGPIWRVLGSASEDSACLRAWPPSHAFVAPTGPAQGHRSAGLGWSPLEWSPSCEGRGSLQMEGSNGLCA